MEKKDRVLSEDEEDQALWIAMEEGRKEGLATVVEKQEFESFLLGTKHNIETSN